MVIKLDFEETRNEVRVRFAVMKYRKVSNRIIYPLDIIELGFTRSLVNLLSFSLMIG